MCAQQQFQGFDPSSFCNNLRYCLEHNDVAATINGNGNVYAATVGPPYERSVIFLSPRMAKVMGQCVEVLTSMQSIPFPHQDHNFYIYQVSCLSGDNVISLMQAVMQTPSYESIRATLLYLKWFVPQFEPTIVNIPCCQKEEGVWKEVYSCVIRFTFISFVTAVLKEVRKIGLTNLLEENHLVRSMIRSFLSIPLLPREMIHRAMSMLVKRALRFDQFDALETFFHYFFDTWMVGFRYETLSVYAQDNRTNSASQAAQINLHKETKLHHHPTILQFINGIRNYEWHSYESIKTPLSALHYQKVSTLRNDAVIQNSTASLLAGDMSIKRFLRVTSTRVIGVFYDSLRPPL